jgi:hypothetical protein
MLKSVLCTLTAAAVTGIALAPGVASAAPKPSALAHSSTSSPSGGDPNTTVTFTVTVGGLTMTAPATADLGSGAPGTTISGTAGPVTVTDDRALLTAAWTATASATSWTTGGGTPNETIPASDVGYNPGTITTTGTITATGTPITLSGAATPVVVGSAGVGDNTATWNPVLAVAVPAAAVGGVYAGTLTHSVS